MEKKINVQQWKKNVAKKSMKEEYVRQQIGDKERASYRSRETESRSPG